MGKPTGFKEYKRELPQLRKIQDRLKDFKELHLDKEFGENIQTQGARCMDCGIPFCSSGCPLGNIIPAFNDAVYKGKWEDAINILSTTNNFPEFTGRICPAPCEGSCTVGINKEPITICTIERFVADKAFELGYIKAVSPEKRSGKRVAIVGSGPAGLAAAHQLNRAGHFVNVYERSEEIGGLLAQGIPDYKLDKGVVKRRVNLLKAEGIEFYTNTHIGVDYPVEKLLPKYDVIVLTGGSTLARTLPVEGANLKGIHVAMEFLTQQNRLNQGHKFSEDELISAKDKSVIVIGGGDTGSDCVGTSNRQGANIVHQIEIMPEAPKSRAAGNPWPEYPRVLKLSTSHKEGANRDYCIRTINFEGENGVVTKLNAIRVEWVKDENGQFKLQDIEGSEFSIKCDLVLLAMGFVHPEHDGVLGGLGVELDARGNVKTDADMKTSMDNVFAAGDMRRGQSLVVHAIAEGRRVAHNVDKFLMGESTLPLP